MHGLLIAGCGVFTLFFTVKGWRYSSTTENYVLTGCGLLSIAYGLLSILASLPSHSQ